MKQFIILISLFVFFTIEAYSQSEEVKFERITVEDGLSEGIIMCINQDEKGLMWFGTYDGLNMYDGYKFTVFKNDVKNPNSLSNNVVRAIFEEDDGVFWIGTYDGLNKYIRESSTFTRYKIPSSIAKYSISSNRINNIFKDKNDVFWIGTSNGLFVFDKFTGVFTPYPKVEESDTTKKRLEHIYTIFEDKTGLLWVGTDGEGLIRIDKKTGGYTAWVNNPNDNTSISDNDVFSIYEYSENILLLGTYGGGLNVFNKETEEFSRYQTVENDSTSISSNAILATCKEAGYLWLGTYDGGLNRFSLEKAGKFGEDIDFFSKSLYNQNNQSSINDNSIRSFYKDEADLLWIGTLGEGLSKYDRKKTKFEHYKSKLSNHIYGILEDDEDVLWIGTSRGLEKYNQNTGKHKYYIADSKNKNALPDDRIGPIYIDKIDGIWIGTRGGGLSKFDRETERFTTYIYDSEDSTSLSNDHITSIYEDTKGFLWVGTRDGLNQMNTKTGEFKRYTKSNSSIKNSIRTIYEDTNNILWFGTTAGLHQFNREENKFESFYHDNVDTSSISNSYILSILEDSSNRLWIGTLSGLNLYNRQTQTFTQYHENDGLPNDAISGILEDNNQNLWLSTNKGLSKFNIQEESFDNYTEKDGLQSIQFHRACFKSPSGKLFFTGPNGYNAFYPDSIFNSEYLPPVVIVDFRLFNKVIQAGDTIDSRIILEKHILDTEQIVLSYEDYVFSFEFSALDYSAPQDIKYAYKMEGFEERWNYTDADRRFATYTNLPHGEYTFRVKATNSDGVWVEKEASLRVTITPPFWKTWLFRIVSVLLVAGSLFFVYNRRINRVERQKVKLELQVVERTQKLEESHEETHQLNEELIATNNQLNSQQEELSLANNQLNSQKEELEVTLEELKETQLQLVQSAKMASIGIFTAGIAHEINNPLNFIQGGKAAVESYISENLLEHESEITPFLKFIDLGLEKATDIIKSLDQFNSKSFSYTEKCNINLIVDNCLLMLQNQLQEEITITKDYTSEDYTLKGNEGELHQVFLSVLTNAAESINKKGIITVFSSVEKESLLIKISDTGTGICEESIKKIIVPFYTTKGPEEGTGLGMSIAYSIIKKHKGNIKYISKVGQGTTVLLTFPIISI